jgi:hypothetical protein
MPRAICVLAINVLAMVGTASPVRAQALRSPALATELTNLLTKSGLDAVAAVDPNADGRFVAALAFPKVQLLVVSAKYSEPTLLEQQIAARSYRDVYMALQQSGTSDDKFFIQDLNGDGLRGEDSNGVDVLYEGAASQTVFDGAPQKHQQTKAAYDQKLQAADARYSRDLTLLIQEIKGQTTR